MRAQEKGRRKKAAPLGSQNGKEKGGKAFPALAGMLFPVLRLRHLADAVQLAQQHAHHTFAPVYDDDFHCPYLPFPRRSNENPKAHDTLTSGGVLMGVSNTITADTAVIRVHAGTALVVVYTA